MTEDQLLTPVDVARRCQVSTKTVLRAIHAGRLRASRLGSRGAYRVRAADVSAWLERTATTHRRDGRGERRPEPSLIAPKVPSSAGRLVVDDGMGRGR